MTTSSKKTGKQQREKKSQELSSAKRRWFALFTVGFPVLVLICFEICLRLFHYGPNLSLFVTEEIAGKTYHVMNPDVKGRYFTHVEFSPNTSLDYFSVPKPPQTYRIFCLGGSTTVGYPYGYIGSFSTYLRDRIKKLFPEKKFEVINLGLTATNSYTVLDIASNLVHYEPDLIIVYDGHNEFYGALGAASNESAGRFRWLTQLYLRMIHCKTFLFMQKSMGAIAGIFQSSSTEQQNGTMMERLARGQYVPYKNSKYNTCLQNFKANLEDLKSLCLEHHIPLILSSQVSNLRDQPPFISGKDEPDSLSADIQYRTAKQYDSLGQEHDALIHYVKARDLDQLRFRTSLDFNAAIHEACDNTNIFFADMEHVFANESPDSIIGNELILEHLHPNERGYFLMAKKYAHLMSSHNLFAPNEEWSKRDTVSNDIYWQERAITALDKRAAQRRTDMLVSGWPFTLTTASPHPVDTHDRLEVIVENLVKGKTTWEEAHVAAAEYYTTTGKYYEAEKEYRALINQLPLNVSAYLILSQLYLKQGKTEQAEPMLLRSLNIEETHHAYRMLGSIKLDSNKADEAVHFFLHAYEISGDNNERIENGYALAVGYYRARRNTDAIQTLQQVLQLNPQYKPARALMKQLQK